jgi:uncharacterized membrane protein YoaK (UPF0700 family)
MIHKLEPWAWVGGAVLAGIAGMVNAVGYLSYAHQGVTHVTGTSTLAGLALARGELQNALHLAGVVLCFGLGAALSGFLLQNATLRLGRRYGVALGLESALLALAAGWLTREQEGGAYVASLACGLQNAMASTYSGAVLRTTHLTGLVTDLGLALGHRLRGLPVDGKRVRLYFLLTLAFTSGGVAGATGYAAWGPHTLYLPAALTGTVALAYTAYAHRARTAARQGGDRVR